ncbi:hypothetical protein C2G38_639009 [Gigaspora rosea]|uniref:CCHC-type domain-containing protein n=1 Tax=Gigaspora rosea TaxID=44941 RepID=A0A397VS81_9GLOM|nr:hypothetical protein C2G38_639009 [Gigaspora rosea]
MKKELRNRMSLSKHLRRGCPRCQRQGHYILECPKVKLLDEKCTMLTRTLTLEQGEELQELINENLGDPLDDEQIPVALDFILEVLIYIITRDKVVSDLMQKEGHSIVNDGYSEQLDVEYDYRSEAKKVKRRTFGCYQKPAKLEYAEETDDEYDNDWYHGSNSRLKMAKKSSKP